MTEQTRPRFSWRALTSMCVAFAFVVLVGSGIGLFLAPSMRLARDTNWQMWGLTKPEWLDLHLVFSALFLIVTVIHTFFNWRPLVTYLKNRATQRPGFRWEWIVALLLSVVVFVGVRREAPPFSWLLDWRVTFHGGHSHGARSPRAEIGGESRQGGGFGQKTLAQYCAEQGLNLDTTLARLQAVGIKARGTDTFRNIADENGYDRPSEITRLLQNP